VRLRLVAFGLSAALALSEPLSGQDEGNTRQRLTATPALIGQKYCAGDNEIFSVVLDLRVKFVNHGDTPLILDRRIGKAWYQFAVAKDRESLSARNFESHPNLDWIGAELSPSTGSAEKLLRSDFIVVAPAGSSETEIKIDIFVWYQNATNRNGFVSAGRHVIEVYLPAWNHAGSPSKLRDAWRKYGEPVDGLITTEPIEFEVPNNPKVDARCQIVPNAPVSGH
jgi:hypothetical protein